MDPGRLSGGGCFWISDPAVEVALDGRLGSIIHVVMESLWFCGSFLLNLLQSKSS